jgi:hypothetical protein
MNRILGELLQQSDVDVRVKHRVTSISEITHLYTLGSWRLIVALGNNFEIDVKQHKRGYVKQASPESEKAIIKNPISSNT